VKSRLGAIVEGEERLRPSLRLMSEWVAYRKKRQQRGRFQSEGDNGIHWLGSFALFRHGDLSF